MLPQGLKNFDCKSFGHDLWNIITLNQENILVSREEVILIHCPDHAPVEHCKKNHKILTELTVLIVNIVIDVE